MAVVTKLCNRIELSSDTLLESVQSLSSLLHSDDSHVSGIRCFLSYDNEQMNITNRSMHRNLLGATCQQNQSSTKRIVDTNKWPVPCCVNAYKRVVVQWIVTRQL